MKELIIALHVVLLAAVAFLFYRSYAGHETTEIKTEVKLPAKLTSDDIVVYYNQDTLFAKSKYMLGLKKNIEVDMADLERVMSAAKTQYENWARQQEEMVAKGLLSEAEIEKTRNEAARKQQALMDRNQNDEKSFGEMQLAINNKLQDAISAATKVLNKDGKIKFVLVYSKSTPYLHPMEGAVEITDQLVAVVDEIYATPKK